MRGERGGKGRVQPTSFPLLPNFLLDAGCRTYRSSGGAEEKIKRREEGGRRNPSYIG